MPALIVLAVLALAAHATFVGHAANPGHLLLLIAAGPVTALPLLFFAGAASRLPRSTMGLLQYVTAVMQFAIGVLILRESTSFALRAASPSCGLPSRSSDSTAFTTAMGRLRWRPHSLISARAFDDHGLRFRRTARIR